MPKLQKWVLTARRRSNAPVEEVEQPVDAAAEAALVARLREQLATPEAALSELAAAPPALARAALAGLRKAAGADAIPLLALVAERADPAVARAALGELGALPDPAAAAALVRLAEALPDKEQRKEARRALSHLRSLGVSPPATPQVARPTVVAPQPRATLYRAIASHIDGVGSRMLWLFAERPLGGAYLLAAVLNDLVGLKDFYVRDSTRRKLAAHEAEMRENPEITWVELPVDYARWLIQEALALNAESGFAIPTEYRYWRDVVGEPERPYERALAYEEISRFELKLRPELLQESPKLFTEHEVEGWLLSYQEVEKYATELRRIRATRLVLTPESEEERLERVLTQAIREYFTPPRRRALRRRLEETAYIFLRTARPHQARLALAAAVELADTDPLLLPRHPFVRALVHRSIELAIKAARAGVDLRELNRSPFDPVD